MINLLNCVYILVNRLRCLKGWKQFGGSCYHPKIQKSSVNDANKTCDNIGVNNTYLMRIRHAGEFSYAAHIFSTNKLPALLVQIDSQLLTSQKSIILKIELLIIEF